jgi:hypothetical protein
MPNIKRKVDIVSAHINSLSGGVTPTFNQLLSCIEANEYYVNGKLFELSMLDSEVQGVAMAFIETTQDSDLPPVKNKQSKELTALDINPNEEGLAFANILLYDTRLNVLIYEINRNGCYLGKLKEWIERRWNENHEEQEIEIYFPAIIRRNEYNRVIGMTNYRKLVCKLLNPTQIVYEMNNHSESLAEQIIRQQAENGIQTGADFVTIEQNCTLLRLNPHGLSRDFVRGVADFTRNLLQRTRLRQNVETIEITGYSIDPESNRQKIRTIDLLADTFDESFMIPEVQLQVNLQREDRKAGILRLYERIAPELRQIIRA